MEIRPIHESEAVSFLQLICDVFDLDFARARTVFFNEPLFDLSRKWALVEDGKLASVLTSMPLRFGWGQAVGIASVATRPTFRGRGYATELLQTVIDFYKEKGEETALLFAQDPAMYARMGFEPIDDMMRIPLPAEARSSMAPHLSMDEVVGVYEAWSNGHPDRLIRDDARWKAWRWGMRSCAPVSGGYVCVEGAVVREAIFEGDIVWPVGQMTDYVGLRSMCAERGLTGGLKTAQLLRYGAPRKVQMFLTDQF